MPDQRFDSLSRFSSDNVHEGIIMPAFLVSHLWRRKGNKKKNIQLRLGELCSSGTGSWPFLHAAGGFYYFSGRRRGFAAPQMKRSQLLLGTLFRVRPPNAMALFAEGQSLPTLRAICAALWRRRAGVSLRTGEVIYMVPGCSFALPENRPGAVRGLHPNAVETRWPAF